MTFLRFPIRFSTGIHTFPSINPKGYFMKRYLFFLPVVLCFITFHLLTPVRAQDEKPVSYVLTKVRLLAKPGTESELSNGCILGSLEGPTTAMEVLAKITDPPSEGHWLEVAVPATKAYRYVKFAAASGTAVRLAEVEFHSETGKLAGNPFGTNLPQEKEEVAFKKAFDGDSATWFEFPDGDSYAGLDLGGQSQAPRPRFVPNEGGYVDAQEVKIETWPPGVTIRYTLDGSVPDENSPVYEKPIPVTRHMTLAAKSYRSNLAESDVVVVSYRIGPDAVNVPQVISYHIGNSLTDTVNGFLSEVAASGGKNLYYMRKTIPGCGIEGNWKTNERGFASPEGWMNNYERVFAEKKVDHLFLQPFPNPPGIDSDAEFGGNFIQLARKHNSDVQPWLYAQWPAQDWKRDAHCEGAGWMKPAWFPPNREPATWEEAMANKTLYYREVFDRWNELPGDKPVKMIPGGPGLVLLKRAIEAGNVPGITEFFPAIFADGIHLTRSGRYFVALIHYGCMFEESPEGKVAYANSGLTAEQARIFQRIAWEAVLAEPHSGVEP